MPKIKNKDHWYYESGVRYCSRCKTRRCVRQTYGSLKCLPPSEQNKIENNWAFQKHLTDH